MNSPLTILPIAILIMGAYTVPLLRRQGRRVSSGIAIGCLAAVAACSLTFLAMAASGIDIRYHVGSWAPPFGIEVVIGPLEAFMMATISVISLLVALWASAGMDGEIAAPSQPYYWTVFLLTTMGMTGMAMAADLFNLYVFLEVTGIGACALVAAKSNRKATSAAFKYLLLNCIGSGFVLLAIGQVYLVTGHLNLAYARAELLSSFALYPQVVWVATSFFVVGFGIKAALFPLHVWLPDAHASASAPSSAVLSGLVVKIYAFSLVKVLYLLLVWGEGAIAGPPVRWVLLAMAMAAILGGSLFALTQRQVKRLLAYSTVAQIGYIFLGLGLGTATGLLVAMFHILAHALMQACLFLGAGGVALATGSKYLDQYDGMGKRMPVTMTAMSVAALSMIGIPGFVGLVSKWYLAVGSMSAGLPAGAILMVISGVLNACYYLPLLERAWFRAPAGPTPETEGSWFMLGPVVVLAAACIVLGLMPGWLLGLLKDGLLTLGVR